VAALVGFQADISLPFDQEFELYHNALSLCSMKSRLCMSELQIDYKSHHIDLIETGCYENIRKPSSAVILNAPYRCWFTWVTRCTSLTSKSATQPSMRLRGHRRWCPNP